MAKKDQTITIEKPQKMGILINNIILIAALNKDDVTFLENIIKEQKALKEATQRIEARKKEVPLLKRLSDQELKGLNTTETVIKKKLKNLEEQSKNDIKKVSIFTLNDNTVYSITKDNNTLIIKDTKRNQNESLQESPAKHEEIETKTIKTESEKKQLEKNKAESNKTENSVIQKPLKAFDIDSKKIDSTIIPQKKMLQEVPIEAPSEHRKNEPLSKEIKQKIQHNAKEKQGLVNGTWSTIARFRSANRSLIINGTGKNLYIKQIYIKTAATPTNINDYTTVKNNDSLEIIPLDIKLLEWRYLLYKNENDTAWNKLWMWPVWDAYTFGKNNEVYKNSYATKDALVTIDLTVQGEVYVAVYKYTKNKGALRVTPIITITNREIPQNVPYISNFEQFGYRQIVISKNQSALSVEISEEAYKNLIKNNIPLSFRQPHFFITESNENHLQLYDNGTWNNKLKNLKEATSPIQLDWIDKIFETRIEKGAALLKEKFNL